MIKIWGMWPLEPLATLMLESSHHSITSQRYSSGVIDLTKVTLSLVATTRMHCHHLECRKTTV